MTWIRKIKGVKKINNISFESKNDKDILYFTIPIVILIAICSGIGIWYGKLYLIANRVIFYI